MSQKHTLDELNNLSRDELITIILMMQGQLDTLNNNIEKLIEQVRLANSYRFGKHSEKLSVIDGQMSFVFCKPFLYKIAKCFCRLLHLHFVGDCKASTGSYSASRKTLQTLFNCYSTRYGNGSSEFSSSCACSLK